MWTAAIIGAKRLDMSAITVINVLQCLEWHSNWDFTFTIICLFEKSDLFVSLRNPNPQNLNLN